METPTLKVAAVDFLTRVVAGDIRGAYERYIGDGFRHHNPYLAGDADALRKGMEEDEATNPGKKLDVQVAPAGREPRRSAFEAPALTERT